MIGITETREHLAAKKISCAELVKSYLEAARRDNEALNAFTLITESEALRAAAEIDKKLADGTELPPLAGIPFVMKDCISTDGIQTTCASKMLENYVPVFDADTWEKLRGAGAVMIGKGNLDEFAMGTTNETSYFGAAKNPHDALRSPGGSSGGSAAAVAASLAVFGIGSDSGGSVRQPASYCGVVGLKPTYGAVSRYGLISYAPSFDQIGTFTKNVSDAAVVFDTISGRDERDMMSRSSEKLAGTLTGDVRGKKIGVAREFFENLMPEVENAVRNAIAEYEKLGAVIVDITFPWLRESMSASVIISCAEASSNFGRFDGLRFGHRAENTSSLDEFICKTRAEGFGGEVRRRVLFGTYVLMSEQYERYFSHAQKLRLGISNELHKLLTQVDFLLTPTTPTTALLLGDLQSPADWVSSDIFTTPANLAGLPAISLPCGTDSIGLPVGMQLIGGKFKERAILDAALAFETQTAGQYVKPSGYGVKD